MWQNTVGWNNEASRRPYDTNENHGLRLVKKMWLNDAKNFIIKKLKRRFSMRFNKIKWLNNE